MSNLTPITQYPWTEPRCYPGRVKGSTERIAIYGNKGRTLVAEIHPMSTGHAEEALSNFRIIGQSPELCGLVQRALVLLGDMPENWSKAEHQRSVADWRRRALESLTKTEGSAE